MPLVKYAEGTALFIRARSCKSDEGTYAQATPAPVCLTSTFATDAHRLGRMAQQRFEDVLAATSADAATLCNYGFLVQAVLPPGHPTALELYERAVAANPKHVRDSLCMTLPQLGNDDDDDAAPLPSTGTLPVLSGATCAPPGYRQCALRGTHEASH